MKFPRRSRRSLPLACLLGLAALAPGCRRQDQIGSITEYVAGGAQGGGGSSEGGVGGSGNTGVVVLNALFSGALIGAGAPELGLLVPESGEAIVLPTSPVVAIFSESIDPASVGPGSFRLLQGGGGIFDVPMQVPAFVAVDLATDGRVALLLPTQPLMLGAQYTIELSGVVDLEGRPLTAPESDSTSPFGGIPGAAISQSFQVFTPGFQAPTFRLLAMYPPPGDKAARRDTVIRLFFNAPVSESVTGSVTVEADGKAVAGDVEVLTDPRVVEFAPDKPFPLGADVRVRVAQGVTSGPVPNVAPGGLVLGIDYDETFRINSVPAPSAITLPGNAPFQISGVMFDGTLTQQNLKDFKADVKVPSATPNAEETTLLFFQPKGAADNPARAFTKKKGVGTVSFEVNLGKGDDAAAFTDSADAFPPQPLLLGAFAQRGGLRSPVGPDVLPQVFVETSKPDVVLGPPSVDGDPYTFRTVVGDTAVYGTATEPLNAMLVQADVGTVSSFAPLVLGVPPLVTDGALLFLSKPPVPAAALPRYLSAPITGITIVDAVGNERTIAAEKAGAIHYEGLIGGALEAGATDDLRVRVVAAHTLLPVKNVDVRVDAFPFVTGAAPVQVTTGKDGEAVVADTSGLGPRLLVTASKAGFEAFTVAGFANPAFAAPMGVSVVLEKTDVAELKVDVTTSGDLPSGGDGFVASGASSGRPATGKDPAKPDTRFFIEDLDLDTDTFLRVLPARPFLVSSLEYDGGSSFALQQSGVLVATKDVGLSFDYADQAATMDFAAQYALGSVTNAQVTGAGITGPALAVGRLVATLPGLPDVFPLSLSGPKDPSPGANLPTPIPPSLFTDEVPPEVDPAYEVILQPTAATVGGAPSDAELETALRLELEATETGSTRLSRQRVSLDFNGASNANAAEAIALPNVFDVMQVAGTFHPLEVGFASLGTGSAFDAGRSVVRLTLTPPSGKAKWTVLLDASASGLAPGTFEFPDLALDPFDQVGPFDVVVEVIEMPLGFDFDAFTFSDLARDQRRLSRSETAAVDTTP